MNKKDIERGVLRLKSDAIKRNTTAELVIERILNSIEAGELNIGDRLPPAHELMKIFGVGRSSIREAVRALGVLGYLEILPGKGTFIKKNSSSEELLDRGLMDVLESGTMFDILEARDCLESKCAELTAMRVEPTQLKKIENAIKKMKEPGAANECINKADLEFHLLIAEFSGNDVIYEIMKLLIEKTEVFADKFWATLPKAKEIAIATANQVLFHVTNGDGQKAAESMHEHLELVKDKLKDVILEGAGQRTNNLNIKGGVR
jgi:GntR family transcriptional repressor for pyruvate dehydrogenase complex